MIQNQSLAEKERTQEDALRFIAREIEKIEDRSPKDFNTKLWKIKLDSCRIFGLSSVPKNSSILERISAPARREFEPLLRRKGIRTRSGIAVVTAMTKPFDCPHGTCIFCPGGRSVGTPQSYTKNSPAAAYGEKRNYDSLRQVKDTLEFLEKNGHDTSKVELILLGGTILAMPIDYQMEFVKRAYDGLNGFESQDLSQAIMRNESASHRCVGLTIETKPDWCQKKDIDLLLSFGATRVEIGVQSLQEDVLRYTNRGHDVRDTINAFKIAKDSAFKIVAHMMPGLPLSDPDKDLSDLLALVEDPQFRPDMLKIYPTLVIDHTPLYNIAKMGKYAPYRIDSVVEILSRFKAKCPPWMRIMRIQREIPKSEVSSGPGAGNLRQLVLDRMNALGWECKCIRCREVGGKSIDFRDTPRLSRIDYESSSGSEIFLSYEIGRSLLGFLRLRIPSGAEFRRELEGQRASLVRELHVYGQAVPIGQKVSEPNQAQHRGLGTSLLSEAEKISKEDYGRRKLVVISAAGTREYYFKRGYRRDGAYVSKLLT